ncbi:MAG: AAA family ATPase [Planctomycetota bacterium]|nr:AAA family ATPase [Planctomycetota bacterium]
MSSQESLQEELDSIRQAIKGLLAALDAQLIGQPQTTRQILECLIAGGHALIEGAPGLGKTTLDFQRIQFTPDLMPADIIGARILNFDERGAQGLTFEPGPIHTQVLLADEINRATPRTQSALLEAMEEHQVTVFGETRELGNPFMVVATQNPIEMEGTFPLPEAQLDRFLVKLHIDMPKATDLAKLYAGSSATHKSTSQPMIERALVLRMQELAQQIPVGEDVARKVARIVHASHPDSELAGEKTRALVRHGSSPRGGLAMLAMARARTLMAGGLHVKIDELEAVAVPCLRHRILPNYEGMASDVPVSELIQEAMQQADA